MASVVTWTGVRGSVTSHLPSCEDHEQRREFRGVDPKTQYAILAWPRGIEWRGEITAKGVVHLGNGNTPREALDKAAVSLLKANRAGKVKEEADA